MIFEIVGNFIVVVLIGGMILAMWKSSNSMMNMVREKIGSLRSEMNQMNEKVMELCERVAKLELLFSAPPCGQTGLHSHGIFD